MLFFPVSNLPSDDLNKLISDLAPNSLAPLLDSSDTDTRQTSIDDASEFNDLIPIVESEEKHWDPQTKEAFNAFLAIFNSIKVPFFLHCEGKLPTHAYPGNGEGSEALLPTFKGLDQGIYDPHRPIEGAAVSEQNPQINHKSMEVRPVIPYPVTHLLMVYGLNRSLTLSMRMGVTNQLQDSQQHGTPNVHLIEQLVSNCITELKELSKPYGEFNWFCLAS